MRFLKANSQICVTTKRRNPAERAREAKKIQKVPVFKHRLTDGKRYHIQCFGSC